MDDGRIPPSEYLEDNIRYAADDLTDRVGHDVSFGAKKAVNKGKEQMYLFSYRKNRRHVLYRQKCFLSWTSDNQYC